MFDQPMVHCILQCLINQWFIGSLNPTNRLSFWTM